MKKTKTNEIRKEAETRIEVLSELDKISKHMLTDDKKSIAASLKVSERTVERYFTGYDGSIETAQNILKLAKAIIKKKSRELKKLAA